MNKLSALETMHARHSIREFTDALIPDSVIRELVTAAGRAPSSKNTQPWQLRLVRGKTLKSLRADMLTAFDEGAPVQPDYAYSPHPLPGEWMNRARACGIGIFKHKGIGREDKEKRRAHDRANYAFFQAPQVFFLLTQKGINTQGTLMDCGFVLNNLMLGLTALGYGSCPQFSVACYPDIIRKHLPGCENMMVIAGLPAGIPTPESHVNLFQPDRLSLESWFDMVE